MRDASKTQEVNESYKTQEVWKVTSCPGSFPRLHKLYNADERGSPGSTMPPLGCAPGCMSCPPHQCGLFSDAPANSPLIPKPDLGGIISLVCCQCPACDRHLLVSPPGKAMLTFIQLSVEGHLGCSHHSPGVSHAEPCVWCSRECAALVWLDSTVSTPEHWHS